MGTFSIVDNFGGKILPNTNYTIQETDLLSGLGASAPSFVQSFDIFRYGLSDIVVVPTGVPGNRDFSFNIGNINYGEYTSLQYTIFDDTLNSILRTSRKDEFSVDNSSLPPNPNIAPPVRNTTFNLNTREGGNLSKNTTYIINESELLAGFSDLNSDTLRVSVYGDGSQLGLPVVRGASTTIVDLGGSPGNRNFQIQTGEGNFTFFYTVSDFTDYGPDNYYTATNGRQTVLVG